MGNSWTKTSSKKSKVTEVDKAVLNIKVQKRKIGEYQKRLEGSKQLANQRAKEYLDKKERQRALMELRKKKVLDQSMETADSQLLQLEQTLLSIMQAKHTSQVLQSLKEGNAAVQQMQASMKVEDVEKLMESIAESQDHLNEVNSLLGTLSPQDEEEAELELQKIEAENLKEALPSLPTEELKMPEQPYTKPAIVASATTVNAEDANAEAVNAEVLRQNAGEGVIRQMEPMLAA
mmetsp:Transcript_467/g.971  ORF Transcript_467/g.971 Transcript_467/m.971 type:complete len:234 (+) Transcript_467:421-1122(+)|eukprot:CAMPEP_0114253402 /NCGR_PEP_ID=MMETSP0058-20121206/16371_1 /TAXON_ID=36894 /ORGANISM="Pyramimonas parkeae, CCMP726" /LENGTH=233 /DNA_ID=CAMNT_0001367441 /DNA_START=367 /DNA_END=1068 /DNA_ORIENTATION=-